MPIKITSLTKEFQKTKKVLTNVTTTLPANDITVIIGKNGSGKSTLLNCIGGLLSFENGNIEVDISDMVKYNLTASNQNGIPKNSRLKIGHIFQQKVLWNHLSIIENIIHPLIKVHKLPKDVAIEKAKYFLDLLKLETGHYKKYPSQLSGGQQRKVAIARTLSMEPDLLLIDELEANLDQSSLKLTMDVIKEHYIDTNKTVLIISHSIDLLEQFTPYIIVLDNGTVLESAKGTKELLLRDYNSPAKARAIKDSVDSSSTRWFLANLSLMAAIKISEINLSEENINNLFIQIGKEISKLITRFDPDAEHLLMIATKSKKPGTSSAEVKIRCAEKSEKFLLNGKEVHKLDGLIAKNPKEIHKGQLIYEFDQAHESIFLKQGGFYLGKKTEVETHEHNSLIDLMFDTNGETLSYKYTDRHPEIKGAYNIEIPIKEDRYLEKRSYYEFSKNTANVYLVGCAVNHEIKGIISIDTTSEKKWSDFIIQQLILVGNMVAIAIKNHEIAEGA